MNIITKPSVNKLFLTIGMLLLSLSILAQETNDLNENPLFEHYSVKYFNTENGLPQNEVVDLYLTPNNFLWISTRIGVVRYDGREMKWMNNINGKSILNLRRPWFYEKENGEVLIIPDYDNPLGIKENGFEISPISPSRLEGLSFGNKGAYNFKGQRKKYRFDFIPIDSTRLYTNSNAGLSYYNGQEFIDFVLPDFRLSINTCFKIKNRVFNLTDSGFLIELNENRIDTVLKESSFIVQDPNLDNNQIFWHHQREECFLIKNDKLYEIQFDGKKFHFQLILSGFPSDIILSIIFSKKDNLLFLGTRKNGLMQVRKTSILQTQINESCHGSVDNYAIALIGEDSIVNTSGILFHQDNSPCKKLFEFNWDEKNLFYDNETDLIYGSSRGGIKAVQLNKPTEFKSYFLEENKEEGQSILKYNNQIYFVLPGVGLCKLKNDSIIIVAAFDFTLKSDGFQLKAFSDSVFYYVGYFGLVKINPIIGVYEFLEMPFDGGITSVNIFDENIWVTTFGDGIYIYEQETWLKFLPSNYWPLQYSHEILRDGERVLIPTNSGLYCFNSKEIYDYGSGKISEIQGYIFNESDGLLFKEFNGRCQNTSITTSNGIIYFPTLKGLVKYSSKLFQPFPVNEEIFIEKVYDDKNDSIVGNNFTLNSQYENFQVKLLHPFYGDPLNAHTFYRIPEISKSWFPFNMDEPIKVDRLPTGSYSMEVYIHGFDGANNKKQRILSFIVKPPFYYTSEFVVAAFFVFILFILLVFYLVQLRSKKNRIRLEKIIRQRTEELIKSKKSVEMALNIREKMITVFSHDIRGPLAYFRQIVTEVQHKVKGLNIKGIDKELNYLHMSADASFTTADNVVNWIEGQIRLEEGEKTIVNLDEEVLRIIIKRNAQFERSNIEVSFDVPSCFILMETGGVEIILNNIIQNAVKYTHSFIKIKGEINSNNQIEISIMDDGGGVTDSERLDKLNTGGLVSSRVGRNGQLGSGLGLFMVREIVNRNKGILKFSNFSNGLKVLLIFPQLEEDLIKGD